MALENDHAHTWGLTTHRALSLRLSLCPVVCPYAPLRSHCLTLSCIDSSCPAGCRHFLFTDTHTSSVVRSSTCPHPVVRSRQRSTAHQAPPAQGCLLGEGFTFGAHVQLLARLRNHLCQRPLEPKLTLDHAHHLDERRRLALRRHRRGRAHGRDNLCSRHSRAHRHHHHNGHLLGRHSSDQRLGVAAALVIQN